MESKFFVTLLCSLAFVSCSFSCTTNNDILADIIFVVDGSGSIGEENFELVRSWLINATTEMFNAFGSRAQYEVLQYSSQDPDFLRVPIADSNQFEIPFRFGQCKNIRCMSSRLQNMRYLNSATYTYFALRRVMEVELPLSVHYPDSKKAIILLTDGAADDAANLPEAFEKTVEENITPFAIGVGDYRLDQLKIFANGGASSERVHTVPDFESLSSVISVLREDLEKDGFFCDECASGSYNCSVHAECINTPDSYRCDCKFGYYKEGHDCKPIDYCSNNPCLEQEHSACVVENYTAHCICNEGYREDEDVCIEINECEPNPCEHEHSECIDLLGEYLCTCANGYEWNGERCSDSKDPPFDIIFLVTVALALLAIVGIATFVLVRTCRRQRTFTPKRSRVDSDSECRLQEYKADTTV